MKKSLSVILTLLMLVSLGICQGKVSPALLSLVEAERAFARTSVEKGIRASFIEFFADDGIGFGPHPMKMKEAYLRRPAPATKPPVTLNWQPVYADVSQAGDLGYTTGPYVFSDQSPENKPPHYGFYFSIWKKQADGIWKVEVDCGIDTPDHSKQTFEFKPAPQAQPKRAHANVDLVDERAALMGLDQQFMKAASSQGVLSAYVNLLAADARLHRNDMFPLIGKDAAGSLLSKVGQFTWEPISSDVSQSDDLGYTYGKYDLKLTGSQEIERGYYVRVWKRDGKGKWKIVLDTLSPTPPENK